MARRFHLQSTMCDMERQPASAPRTQLVLALVLALALALALALVLALAMALVLGIRLVLRAPVKRQTLGAPAVGKRQMAQLRSRASEAGCMTWPALIRTN